MHLLDQLHHLPQSMGSPPANYIGHQFQLLKIKQLLAKNITEGKKKTFHKYLLHTHPSQI